MKIAITGANGFIGRHVVDFAIARGHETLALVRLNAPEYWQKQSAITITPCDLTLAGDLAEKLRGVDCVIHLAAVMKGDSAQQYTETLKSTQNVLNAMDAAGITHLVAVSSISVLDYVNQSPMACIDEQVATLQNDAELGPYAKMKRDQERVFLSWAKSADKQLTLIRPGLVFDEKNVSPAHAGFVKGNKALASVHGGQVPLAHVRNVAEALIGAAELPLKQETVHIVDDILPTQKEYLQVLSKTSGLKYLPLPWQLYALFAFTLRVLIRTLKNADSVPDSVRRNSVAGRMKPFTFSNDKAKSLLGWTPEYSFQAQKDREA